MWSMANKIPENTSQDGTLNHSYLMIICIIIYTVDF